MTDWKLGQYVRVWRNEGYEYGHIGWVETKNILNPSHWLQGDEVLLVGDDGREIYARVKDLEEGA